MTPGIRVATGSDAGAVCAIYSPIVKETAISFEYEPPSAGEMRRRIGEALERFPFLVIERDGEVAGYAYAGPHRRREAYRWAVEVSVFVRRDHRRRGAGRALYGALLQLLRLQGFVQAFAVITIPNPASIAFHETLGFRRIGTCKNVGFKLGFWRDTGWWHLLLRKPPEKPLPPEPFPAVRDRPQAKTALGA